MPRDPDRIAPTLELVRLYWRLHPDLRLGQLVLAISNLADPQLDPFYLEDDRLQQKLREELLRFFGVPDESSPADFLGLAERQQDLSPEIQQLVDEHFWELVDSGEDKG